MSTTQEKVGSMNFGEKLKRIRTEKNLTQPRFAEAIGIEQSYLSKLENDKSQPSDAQGRVRMKLLVSAAGVAEIQMLDETGKVSKTISPASKD